MRSVRTILTLAGMVCIHIKPAREVGGGGCGA